MSGAADARGHSPECDAMWTAYVKALDVYRDAAGKLSLTDEQLERYAAAYWGCRFSGCSALDRRWGEDVASPLHQPPGRIASNH